MRAGFLVGLLAFSVAQAQPHRQPKKPPSPKPANPQQDEINELQKELTQLEIKQATFAAAKVARKLYEAQKKKDGEDALDTIRRKERLGSLLHQTGADVDAIKVYKELVATAEKLHGPMSREVKNALSPLVNVYWSQSHYDDAEPVVRRMLEISKQLDGPESSEYATELGSLGSLLLSKNEFTAAQGVYEEIVRIREKLAKAPDEIQLVSAKQGLASMYWQSNQRAKAIPIYDDLIAVLSKSTGNFMFTSSILYGIAATYHYTGREDLAAPLRKRVTDMFTKEIAKLEKDKPDDPSLSGLLGQLGYAYRQANDFANADKVLTHVIELDEKKSHFSGWYSVLAEVKRAEGKPKEAVVLLQTAEAELTKMSPKSAGTYKSLIADAMREAGDYKHAQEELELYRQNIERTFGKKHPVYGMAEQSIARTLMESGEAGKAEVMLADSLEIAERELGNVLKTGTETDHAIYFQRNAYVLDMAVNFGATYAPASVGAARIGLTTLLRRKGRVLDAAATSLATLRKRLSADDKKLLDDLASARTQLAKLMVAGPQATGDADYGKEIAALEDQIQKLEVQVGKKSAAYRVVTQAIDLPGVQRMIPRDARLVEIVNYQGGGKGGPYNPNPVAIGPRHYGAYIVGAAGDAAFVDLGPEGPIDTAVEQFRKAVADPQNQQVVDLGKNLYALTIGKLAAKLGGATNVLIAPDGKLSIVPFSALVDGKGEFLVKTYTFTYLTSGRDLLRVAVRGKAQGGGVIFADPTFDGDAPKAPGPKSRGTRSVELSSLSWPALPGTGQEADAVGKTMPGLKIYRGAQATESAVKGLHGPKILHLATHGFFLPDEVKPAAPAAAAGGAATPAPETYENPLLRSGLAFAGANKLVSGDDDGILTALEASGLDLEGTRLVVLSACETGVGKVTNGEGVYGLRRALVIAGAESLVMSLWQVDDAATKDLMSGYYGRLKAGRGKSSALRDIQLEMLKKDGYAHPYYWASFLPAGDNSPL